MVIGEVVTADVRPFGGVLLLVRRIVTLAVGVAQGCVWEAVFVADAADAEDVIATFLEDLSNVIIFHLLTSFKGLLG